MEEDLETLSYKSLQHFLKDHNILLIYRSLFRYYMFWIVPTYYFIEERYAPNLTNSFNACILKVMQLNMAIQFILDGFS